MFNEEIVKNTTNFAYKMFLKSWSVGNQLNLTTSNAPLPYLSPPLTLFLKGKSGNSYSQYRNTMISKRQTVCLLEWFII